VQVLHGNAALKLAVPMWHASQNIGTADMITVFCAIGAVVILAYAAFVLAYLRRLPEPEDR
jgi:cytochrome bd-type quinol oxidase subunit 2